VRPVEGVELPPNTNPEELILDGFKIWLHGKWKRSISFSRLVRSRVTSRCSRGS
jgi:hypothetical protein